MEHHCTARIFYISAVLYSLLSLRALFIRYLVYVRSVGILDQLLERDQERERGRRGKDARGKGEKKKQAESAFKKAI